MKSTANEYELQKLNANFDKKLGRLSEEYRRKADAILDADCHGFGMQKRTKRLWMWFDEKTRYQLVPKIVVLSFALIFFLFSLVALLGFHYNMETLFSINLGAAFVLLGLMLGGSILALLAVLRELTGHRYRRNPSFDVVTNPGWKHLRYNIWHRETDD